MGILENLQNFRVRYGSVTELTEAPGIVARACRPHIYYKNDLHVPRVFVALAYRTSRSSGYRYEFHTELPAVPGTGMNVLQNSQKFLYTVIPGVNTPGMVCACPTEPNLVKYLYPSTKSLEGRDTEFRFKYLAPYSEGTHPVSL